VGIGFHPLIIDRPGGDSDKLVIETRPFQIPLGALVTKNHSNFLVGGATVSTTFITNTAYNTPSVEWAIGEAAGEAAAYCAGLKIYLDVLATTESHILGLQEWLVRKRGVPIYWYDDVTPHDKDFVRAQLHPFRDPSHNTSSRTLDYYDNPSHSRR
jgi:hypothetical protein